ncbi:MAG: hypothetical protein K9G67_09455 [Bacteroidales bacterium]|nr:hypothetical protein [Bacteroidales bacterium]MCF8349698.1 hypothetical protein [Bacteroidales bacterium]MCF8376568.1 hypothetical protein [Bacteroidales bacterium]MCF8402254.1 hypothetical protein [Bacteroidales bacterium]
MRKNNCLNIVTLISFALILIVAGSCKSSKETTDPNEVKIYCSGPEYMTSEDYLRTNATGVSTDMEIARDKALTTARNRLSAQIETFVSNLTDFYKKDTRIDENEKMENRFENLVREVYDNRLVGTHPICEKVLKEDGRYRAYVAIELGGSDLIDEAASQISADEELKVDYDYEKFKESYKEAMEELKEKRAN